MLSFIDVVTGKQCLGSPFVFVLSQAQLLKVLWRKGDGRATLSRGEHLPDPCLDRLLLLFWALTLRMVLIYYAQVHFRWLLFTENKGEDVANYIRKEGYLQM